MSTRELEAPKRRLLRRRVRESDESSDLTVDSEKENEVKPRRYVGSKRNPLMPSPSPSPSRKRKREAVPLEEDQIRESKRKKDSTSIALQLDQSNLKRSNTIVPERGAISARPNGTPSTSEKNKTPLKRNFTFNGLSPARKSKAISQPQIEKILPPCIDDYLDESAPLKHIIEFFALRANDKQLFRFLLTYKFLSIDPMELIGGLCDIYQNGTTKVLDVTFQDIIMSISKFICNWLTEFNKDFLPGSKNTKSCISVISFVANKIEQDGFKYQAMDIREAVDQKKQYTSIQLSPIDVDLSVYSPTSLYSKISKYSVKDIAQQITYIDHVLFQTISEIEFGHMNWAKEKTKPLAPNLKRMIDRFNDISQWTASEIAFAGSKNSQKKTIKYFLTLAKELEGLGNYHSLMAIIAGLSTSPVIRLVNVWNSLSTKWHNLKFSLEQLMCTRNNFSVYRQKMKELNTYAIPYIGVYMKDLVVFVEGSSFQKDTETYNCQKLKMIQQLFQQIETLKSFECPYKEKPELILFLSQLYIVPEEELYDGRK